MVKPKRGTGIYGHVELYRHYHDGQSIVVDASVYASNGTMVELNAASWYRHTQFGIDNGVTLWELEVQGPSEQLSSGESYNSYGSPMISYWVGGNIEVGQEIKLNAHVHLQVGGRVWHEENNAWTHTFDRTHNKDYQPD